MNALGRATLALLCFGSSTNSFAVNGRTVAMLHRAEVHAAMTVSGDQLVIGLSRGDRQHPYRLEIYAVDGSLKHRLNLKHSVNFTHPYKPGIVLVNGINPDLQKAQFSLIDVVRGQVQTKSVPDPAWADQWLGTIGGTEYFSDSGGNLEDPEAEEDLSLTAQTIVGVRQQRSRYLPARISRPTKGFPFRNGLLIAEARGVGSAAQRLIHVLPGQAQVQQVVGGFPLRIGDFLAHAVERTLVVGNEVDATIVGYNDQDFSQLWQLPLGDYPTSVIEAGHCVLVGGHLTKRVNVVDIRKQNAEVRWSELIDNPESEFRTLNKLAVDLKNKIVYARSNYGCNPLVEACQSDNNRILALESESLKETLTDCQK